MWPKGKKRVVQEVDGVSTDDIAEKRIKSDLPIFKEPISGVIITHQTGDMWMNLSICKIYISKGVRCKAASEMFNSEKYMMLQFSVF